MGEVKWYLYGYFWRRGDNDGDDTPLDRGDGTGDLLFNSFTKDVIDGCVNQRAIDSFFEGGEMLRKHQRWPNEMNTGEEAPNRWIYYLTKPLKIWTRPQSDMTRDPYIAWFTFGMHLLKSNLEEHTAMCIIQDMERMRIPWYLYRPKTWRWCRRLLKDLRPHYIKRLDYFRNLGSAFCFELKYENDFYKDRTNK